MEHRPESPAHGKPNITYHEIPTPAIVKLQSLLGNELRLTTHDGRIFIGNFACTDKELNVVLTNVYEFPIDFQKDHLVESGRFVGMLMFPWKHIRMLERHLGQLSFNDSSEIL
ncbi:hypothetical protein CPB86DRAFT_776078 [Serendipita vermifera]|nr:hypothetical protein CPB86DRAFT_776078 [Serendipita vermifera]